MRGGQLCGSHFGPLYQGHRVGIEQLFETCVAEFFLGREPIKIKVIQSECYEIIRFDQRVGRTLYPTVVAKRPNQCATECGFTGPQWARQMDDTARLQRGAKNSGHGGGGLLVGQQPLQGLIVGVN